MEVLVKLLPAIMLLSTLTLAPQQAPCAQPCRIIATRTAHAPVIDGKLDDAVWAQAKEIGGFRLLGSTKHPEAPTYVKTLITGDSLYVGFRCVEPNMKRLKAITRPRNESVWLDDSVEVILDPNNTRKELYHLIMNAAGSKYGVPSKVTAIEHADDQKDWNGEWTVKTARSSRQWTVEMRLPLAVFGIDVKANPCVGINFARERIGAKEESSTWSPTRMLFINPSGLGEMVLPNSKGNYCLLDVGKPMLGMKRISVSVTNHSGHTIQPRLHFVLSGAADASGQVTMPALAEGKKADGALPISINRSGEYNLALTMDEAATGTCLCTSNRRYKIAAALTVESHPFELYAKKAEARIAIGLPADKLKGCKLNVALRQLGSTSNVEARVLPCQASVSSVACFDLKGRASGSYVIYAEIVRDGSIVASEETPALTYNSNPKISVESDGFLSVDGKPYFPVGIYTLQDKYNKDHDAILKEAHEAGFNTTVYYSTDPSYLMPLLDACERNGIKAIVYPTTAFSQRTDKDTENTIIHDVTIRKNHPALLAWYLVDEPEGIGKATPEMVAGLYRTIKAADSQHPCCLVVMSGLAASNFGGQTDIVWVDPYPVPHSPVTYVSAVTSSAVEAVQKGKPVWVVPQAFDWSVWNNGHIGKEHRPTNAEERCMTYLALVHGAKGIIYWAHTASKYYIRDYPEHWAYMKKLAGEMRDLTPILLTQTKQAPKVAPKSATIDTMVKELNGQFYVFAVNHATKPCKASFALPGGLGKQVEVLFEGRRLQARNGAWKDVFAPLEVHVYKIDAE